MLKRFLGLIALSPGGIYKGDEPRSIAQEFATRFNKELIVAFACQSNELLAGLCLLRIKIQAGCIPVLLYLIDLLAL